MTDTVLDLDAPDLAGVAPDHLAAALATCASARCVVPVANAESESSILDAFGASALGRRRIGGDNPDTARSGGRMKMVCRIIVMACLAMLPGALAACGGGDAEGNGGRAAGSPAAGRLPEPSTAPLRVGIAHPAGNMDPRTFDGEIAIMNEVYDPLVGYGPGGRPVPGLATRWTTSGDGRTWTFTLRNGVRFHDGTLFDARAAKWNFDQWVGKDDFAFLGASQRIERVRAVDASTLEVRLKRPYPLLLADLATVRPVRFLSPRSVDAQGRYRRPLGSGPLRVVEASQSRTVLEPVRGHWRGGVGYGRVVLPAIEDGQARLNALRAGELDVLGGVDWSPISPQEAAQIRADRNLTLVTDDGTTTLLLGFNADRGRPFAERDARAAVRSAVDTEQIAERLFGGFAGRAVRMFPDTLPDAGPAFDHPHDPDAARAALGGRRIRATMIVPQDSQQRALGEAISSQLADVGVDLRLQSLDDAAYGDALTNRRYDVALFPTYGAPYDPYSYLSVLFYSKSDNTDGKIFVTPQTDRLVEQMINADDMAGVSRAVVALERLVDAEVAAVPLVHPQRIWAYGPNVTNFALPATDFDLPLSRIEVGGDR